MWTKSTAEHFYGIRIFTFSLTLFFIVAGLWSCDDDTPIEMSPSQKRMVDTLFTRRTPSLRQELDSLCEVTFDERVALAVDSILALRLREKEELLNRGQ